MTAPSLAKPSKGDNPLAEPGNGADVRAAIDRSSGGGRGGSVVLVLLVAALLVGAATVIVMQGGSNAEPYILVFLAMLATVGVFCLFALACGILRLSAAETGD